MSAGSVAASVEPSITNASYQNNFYRLFGDDLGDGNIGNADNRRFATAFNATSIASANYNAAFDYLGNGNIGNTDNKAFANRFGLVWTSL